MKITLVMMLKNEAQTIRKTIESILPIIDDVIIGIDNATTDDTLEEAKKALGGKYQSTHFFDFKDDFSKIRNYLIEQANHEWVFILDGHEYMTENSIMYLKELKVNSNVKGIEIFDFTVHDTRQNIYFQQPRLFRSHLRYELPIHNVITQIDNRTTMPQIKIIHDQPLDRLRDRQAQRKKMNLSGLKKGAESGDSRSMYYLADTFHEMQDYKNAKIWFKKYLKISEFPHERYAAKIKLGQIAQDDKQYKEAEKYFLDCFSDDVGLNEHLIFLGDLKFVQKDYNMADFYFTAAAAIEPPDRFLIINMDSYTWLPWYKKALCCMARSDVDGLRRAINKGKQYAPDREEFFKMEEKLKERIKVHGLKKKGKLYIVASLPAFIEPMLEKLNERYYLRVSQFFNPADADLADIIWCEWGDHNAIAVSNYQGKAKKILRIHSYEVYTDFVNKIDFNAFDTVVFIARHVFQYLNDRMSLVDPRLVLENTNKYVIINHGIDLDKFKPSNNNKKGNKIAYAGFISNKKGAMQLLMIAQELKDYEFYVAGRFQGLDIERLYQNNKPDNMFLYGWQEDLNQFYSDKDYFINCSPREGSPVAMLEAMACGLKPLTYNWVGAKELFKNLLTNNYIWNTVKELKENLEKNNSHHDILLRQLIEEHYNSEEQYRKTINLIDSYL